MKTRAFDRQKTVLQLTATLLLAGCLLAILSASALAWWTKEAGPEVIRALQVGLNEYPSWQIGDEEILLEDLHLFYEERAFKPIWVNDHGLNSKGIQALAAIMQAPEHGIHKDHYYTGIILAHSDNAKNKDNPKRYKDLAGLEVLMSYAILNYMQDLANGVAKPERKDRLGLKKKRYKPKVWLQKLDQSNDVGFLMENQAPQTDAYLSLKHALAKYAVLARNEALPAFPAGNILKAGMVDSRVQSLADILLTLGDLEVSGGDEASAVIQRIRYDKTLVEAVKRFQRRHGLEDDGNVGPKTARALNVPLEERMDAIRTTMERMRQLPEVLGNKHILVNLPSYELFAYDEGEKVMDMKVIIGQKSRRTPLFSNHITQAVFNPTWSVPRSIAVKDKLHKIQKDPGYLVRAGFTVTQYGQTVDPYNIDWSSVNRSNFNFGLRQAAGSGNALGKVKFPIPNNDSVYLHDTSSRGLFAKNYRALSSGCIRIEKPDALAQFVLKDEEGWDEEMIMSAYESHRNRHVKVTPVPVHTVYWTAWVDEGGQTHFYDDIYRKDHKILAALGPASAEGEFQLAAR